MNNTEGFDLDLGRAGVLALALAVGSLVGCGKDTAAKPAPPPPVVYVTKVARQDVPLFTEAVASLDGYVNAEIRARVRGYLKTQEYKDGAFVKKGQLLFTVERDEWAAAAQSAKASLEQARAAQQHNRTQLARSQSLRQEGIVSQQELENTSAGFDESQAQVRAAAAELDRAALNLSYTTIRSPIAGVAGIAQVRVGNLVGQDGPTVLTTVSQVDPIRVTFPLSEIDFVRHPERFKHFDGHDLAWAMKQFRKLQAEGRDEDGNAGLELMLADGRAYPLRGVVVAADRGIDPSTGTIQLQALFPNPEGLLRPGQYGRVRFERGNEGRGVLAVPEKALVSVQGTYSVGVVGQDNKVRLRRVELGPSAQGQRVVLNGINEADRIVVEGVQKISDGSPVNPRPVPNEHASLSASQPATERSAKD